MEATAERKKVWERPTRKMTMDELWERFTYDPDYETGDLAYDRAFYDRYGNPTYGTLCWMYEKEHDISEGPMTMEEFGDWMTEVLAEADEEMRDEAARTEKQISA